MALHFNQYASEGNAFLKDYAKHMGFGRDTDKAGRILSAILHALRDIIPINESIQLFAQFPMFLKAVYVNAWSTRKTPDDIRTMEDFIALVRHRCGVSAPGDLGEENELVERYIELTFMFLRRYVSLGEMEDVRNTLPRDLKHMVYSQLMF
ncbi:DUF2267 domain-containing protein [Robiginitalea sp. M366]|uniref:DUF2267 domain-containing protein n=1 Tax=Robiginitalea aestuariiviva TaxID=3036903 RepID=UPI00240DAC16|nr:DUF2267 domain-containing protein [Robiginitalea aestuariiviva]MDG1572037.1 DUF2267 domain-containing protein [Robiginitalea aestuariiviva]